jgi:long-chain acyl-CoA synthetase
MIPGAHDPAKPAVIFGASGAVTTYGELDATANRVAGLLRDAGLEPGDHVALCVENTPAFFGLVWGMHYAGLIYTPCPTGLTSEELAYIVEDCGAKAAFFSARYAKAARDVSIAVPGVEQWFSVGGEIEGFDPYETAIAGLSPTPPDGERIAGHDMLYSSGTTGRPKGIRPMAPAAPLTQTPMVVAPILEEMLGLGAEDVYLSPGPLYHAAPLRFCMAFHQLGAKVVVMERWDERQALELIEDHAVTVTQLVPTMFVRMLRLPEDERAAADTSTLKAGIHAAAPCPVEVKQQMLDWWGEIIHEYYSSTEACGLTWVTPEQWRERPGTVGKPLIGMPHVLGANGRELAPGQDGAIWFSDGPRFEYHNDPEKTRSVTDRRGWQTFGDIGHLDDDGFLYLTDRASYTIISGGVNIYPQEAEDVLQAHPQVMDAAVFGIPDAEFGEAVHAVVQPVAMPADERDAEMLKVELIEHCRSRLSKVKAPRTIDLRAALPRTPTGKLLKRLLKDEWTNQRQLTA